VRSSGLVVLVAAAMMVAASHRVHAAELAGAVIVSLPVAVLVIRFAVASPAARRHFPLAVWARLRWRWLMRNLGLAWRDRHVQDVRRRSAAMTATRNLPALRKDTGRHLTRYPRARIAADAYGIRARVRTIPGSGRLEFDKAGPHIADAWRVARVVVSQPRPGRLIVRGLRRDPLAEPLGRAQAPPGTYDGVGDPARPYLGLSEWAEHRHLALPGQTGIVIGGLPGRGKTSLANSLLWQWSGTPAVQFAILDGLGSVNYQDWHARAWLHGGDDLADAAALLERVHAVMQHRKRAVLEVTGHKNSWHAGPSAAWPLLIVIVDECQQFLDFGSYPRGSEQEKLARRCVKLTADLVRHGRSSMIVTVLATQKCTSDSIPTHIRDNAGISLCFGVKTVEAARAVLGEDIRDYPGYSPTGLQGDQHVGVLTATLRTGADPFCRVRVPQISETAASTRAVATAHLRRDPAALLPGLHVVGEAAS